MIAKGAIGLWGRIHVNDCPFCHGKHYHDGLEPGDTVLAGCGVGKYKLDCSRVSMSCAAPSAVERLTLREPDESHRTPGAGGSE
jgi:hypothetical protein